MLCTCACHPNQLHRFHGGSCGGAPGQPRRPASGCACGDSARMLHARHMAPSPRGISGSSAACAEANDVGLQHAAAGRQWCRQRRQAGGSGKGHNWGPRDRPGAPIRRTLRSWKWASSERCSWDSARREPHSWAKWGQPPQRRLAGEPMLALLRCLQVPEDR